MINRLPLAMPTALCAGLVAGGRGWMAVSADGVVPAVVALLAAIAGLVAVRRARPGAATLLMVVASLLGGWTWGAARVHATAPEPVTRAGAVRFIPSAASSRCATRVIRANCSWRVCTVQAYIPSAGLAPTGFVHMSPRRPQRRR